MPESVAIIGAGVSGLTCGVLFAEAGYRARIFAEETGAGTTSAVAAAIWFPYDAEPAAQVIAWSLQSLDVFRGLCEVSAAGVSMIELRQLARGAGREIPAWALSLGAQFLPGSAIPSPFTSGFTFEVPLIDTTRYLDYLIARFRDAGGAIFPGVHLRHLDEADRDCALVLNCAGIGARTLVPDPEVEPHRGQVVIVPKISQAYAVACDDPPLMYAIPRRNDCVFGGTNDSSSDTNPTPGETARIIAECSRVLGIELPKVLGERVGLRPFRRAGICLRAETLRDGRRVIHNYGHGGSGFTLSWGCAQTVLALAR